MPVFEQRFSEQITKRMIPPSRPVAMRVIFGFEMFPRHFLFSGKRREKNSQGLGYTSSFVSKKSNKHKVEHFQAVSTQRGGGSLVLQQIADFLPFFFLTKLGMKKINKRKLAHIQVKQIFAKLITINTTPCTVCFIPFKIKLIPSCPLNPAFQDLLLSALSGDHKPFPRKQQTPTCLSLRRPTCCRHPGPVMWLASL